MILRRCPSCRTLCDAERDPRCFACGAEYRDYPAVPDVPLPPVVRTARRDLRLSTTALVILAIIGGSGTLQLLMFREVPLVARVVLLGFLLAGAAVGTLTLTRSTGRSYDTAGRIVLTIFAAVGIGLLALLALVVGLVILLFIVCVTGGRIAG